MAASWVIKRWCSSAAAAPGTGTRWERIRNSRAGVWVRSLLSDYKDACREVFVDAYKRPVKATVYLSLLGGIGACCYSNPDDSSFHANLLETSNQLALLSPWIRSGTSDGHVQSLLKLRNEGQLRYASLGLVSVIYSSDYDPDSSLYEARCSAISVPWAELPKRVLDVGFAGHWWVLANKMKDYDINEEEFKHLPPNLASTAPPTPRETEQNERLHEESWKPLTIEEVEQKEEDSKQEAMEEDTQSGEKTQTPAKTQV
ncbi:mitochondrial import inner membrane translocase subunit Tim29 [Chanos chanos]|uniref:Mitochondrial import inner membrane translocase subunit Tim29 n=1 Tax=Chanos chanos TaxID=29144 RepID=A0A6J2VY60_CHACN|nr:mitochondrial import inner membrane translocase subunit Tim29 [Chanos chanos]